MATVKKVKAKVMVRPIKSAETDPKKLSEFDKAVIKVLKHKKKQPK